MSKISDRDPLNTPAPALGGQASHQASQGSSIPSSTTTTTTPTSGAPPTSTDQTFVQSSMTSITNAASSAAEGAMGAASSAGDAIASGTAKALGDASATTDQTRVSEIDHKEIPKEHHPANVPDRIIENPHLGHVPKVNDDGDDERAAEPGIQDLGWSEDPHIPQPVIHGMTNEDFWVLARRFNKQTYHVKRLEGPPPGNLDMNIADKDEFFPDKLRSTLERVYTSVGISFVALYTHILRVRSWKEWRRTALFATLYLAAWAFDYLVAYLSAFALLLTLSPRARQILFPPAPLAAIGKGGKAQVPKSGHLGSNDSATGAAESYKGEAVEQEASNLVNSISHVAVSTAVGTGQPSVDEPHPDDEDQDAVKEGGEATEIENAAPDPTKVVKVSAKAQSKAAGDKSLEVGDHTAAAVDHSVWAQLQPVLHALEDLCDTWERFGNALSPTPPFHQYRNRVFLASAVVLPLFLVSLFVRSTWVYKGTTFGIGFGFFGQPLFDMAKLSDAKAWLDKTFPKWQEALQLRNSLLKGVPTNAQLTITLLRIAEAAKSPLPPPPPAVAAPKPSAAQGHEMAADLPPEYQGEMKEAVQEGREDTKPIGSDSPGTDNGKDDSTPKKKKKKGSFIMNFFKGGVAAGANTALTANAAKATVGSTVSKNRLGVVKPHLQTEARGDGPISFKARCKGKKGFVDILTTAATPSVAFEPEWGAHAKATLAALEALPKQDEDGTDTKGQQGSTEESKTVSKTRSVLSSTLAKARPNAVFSLQINDIAELRKIGGLGWKGKIIVGWALSSEIADGLEITTVTGERIRVTAMPRRDEVFNRLVSLGNQQWEMW